MDNDQRLSGALQENVLTVLVFDEDHCKLVRAAITHRTFESAVYREVAGAAIDFIDQYGAAIGEHLPDHLEHVLKGDDARKAGAYEKLLANLFAARETVNAGYVMTELHKFVRQQNLKGSVIKAVEALEDGRIDDAEVELQKGLNTQVVSFEPGLSLDNADHVAAVFDDPEEEGFDLGITELDRLGIIPRRKELLMLVAPRGKGKSWFITHCCKQALLQRWSAVVITLEMSEKRYAARFLQAFFSISKRESEVRIARLSIDRDGELQDVVFEQIERMTMTDPETRGKLITRAKREFRRRAPLRIKAFPTKSLTIPMLEAYLDGLARFENFTPDLICIDYPDLMRLDPKNLRLELGALIEEIRGVVIKRNAAGVVVSQGNRESEEAKTVTGMMIAEDISKLGTADVLLTYSQTLAEKSLGLARIFVEKARNEDSKMMVLITQAYKIGQFCLDSVKVHVDNYFDLLDDKSEGGRKRRREEPADDDPDRRDRRPGRRRED